MAKTDEQVEAKRFKIIIPSSSGPGGSDDVFLAPNGREMLIKRDMEVEVGQDVIECLNNATITEYITDKDGRMVGDRQVPRFPYQLKG